MLHDTVCCCHVSNAGSKPSQGNDCASSRLASYVRPWGPSFDQPPWKRTSPQQLLPTVVRQTTAFPEHGWFTLVSFLSLFSSCSLSERLLKSETTWITKCSIFAGVIQNQQTVALSEVCAGVCEPTIDEDECCLHSRCSERADTGGWGGGIITRQGEEEEVCSTHAYDGLMLFCMS